MVGLLVGKQFLGYIQKCPQNTVWQTDRQTSCESIVRAMHTRGKMSKPLAHRSSLSSVHFPWLFLYLFMQPNNTCFRKLSFFIRHIMDR